MKQLSSLSPTCPPLHHHSYHGSTITRTTAPPSLVPRLHHHSYHGSCRHSYHGSTITRTTAPAVTRTTAPAVTRTTAPAVVRTAPEAQPQNPSDKPHPPCSKSSGGACMALRNRAEPGYAVDVWAAGRAQGRQSNGHVYRSQLIALAC
jgi:hypothetical protein